MKALKEMNLNDKLHTNNKLLGTKVSINEFYYLFTKKHILEKEFLYNIISILCTSAVHQGDNIRRNARHTFFK